MMAEESSTPPDLSVVEDDLSSRQFHFSLKWLLGIMTGVCIALGGYRFGLYPFLFKVIGLVAGVLLAMLVFLVAIQLPITLLLKKVCSQEDKEP